MSFSLVASAAANGATTGAIDTTGANLIVIGVAGFTFGQPTGTPTDSESNTWLPLSSYENGGVINAQIFYAYNPTTSASHTFTASGFFGTYSVAVQAWNGSASSPFDQENGNGGFAGGSTLAPGSVTPSTNDQLVVSVLGYGGGPATTIVSIGDGFTISDQTGTTPAYVIGMAYLIQTTAAAVNPTWTLDDAPNAAATAIATFEASGGGGGGKPTLYYAQQRQQAQRQQRRDRWHRRNGLWVPGYPVAQRAA